MAGGRGREREKGKEEEKRRKKREEDRFSEPGGGEKERNGYTPHDLQSKSKK